MGYGGKKNSPIIQIDNQQLREEVNAELAQKAEQEDLETVNNLTNALSSNKADKTYVDTKIQSVASGSPKGVYATLSDLETEYPNGTTGIFVVQENGYWYFWDGSAWNAGGVYQSSETGVVTKFGVLSGSSGHFVVDLNNKTITTHRYGSVVAGNNRYNLLDGTYSFADFTSSIAFIAFDKVSREIKFYGSTDMAESEDIIIGYYRAPSNLHIYGVYEINGSTPFPYTESINNKIDSFAVLSNITNIGFLSGGANSFNVDLENEKVITIASGGYVSNGNRRYSLLNGEWSYSSFSVQTLIICFDIVNKSIAFYPSSDFTGANQNDVFVLGVIRRDTRSVDINGAFSINGQNVIPFTKQLEDKITSLNNITIEPTFVITDSINSNYELSAPYVEVSETMQYQEIYNVYDSLVTSYPDYVSRTLLGNDRDDNPIYRYDFTPIVPPLDYRINYSLPKIYYQTAIHGHEKNATMAGALFFKELCEKWKTSDSLRALRHNFHFVVVPVVNPSGFNLNQRKNSNGVDLNRNFSQGWSLNNDPDDLYYGGEEPLSEPETQYVDEIMQSESNIVFAIDNHNSGRFDGDVGDYAYWVGVGAGKENLQKLAVGLTYQMTAYIQKSYDYVNQLNLSYGKVSQASGGTTTAQWDSYNVPAFLLETTQNFVYNPQDTQKANAYFIGNTILNVVKNYEMIKF